MSTLPNTHQVVKGGGDVRKHSKDQLLCASCDSCRARKTKCDSKRPCETCVLSYIRRNNIASAEDIDLKKIKCVYSLAKRRGPTPKRILEGETGARGQEKLQRREEEQSTWRGQEMESSAPNHNNNNLDTASVLNALGMLLNTPAPTIPPPAPPPPIDSMPPTLQQSLFSSSLGSALGIQGAGMSQGVGGGAASNRGYNIMNNTPSAASQHLAYLQQLQQQLHVQHQWQQQLQQHPLTQQGQTTHGTESSIISSSLEETKTQSPKEEVGHLQRRIIELETENADLKQRLNALRKSR